MNRLVAVLMIVIVILVAALAYLFGKGSFQTSPTVTQAGVQSKTVEVQRPSSGTPHRSQTFGVMVGLSSELDACPSNGRVIGLNLNGDNFLAVKAAPSMSAPRIDKLGPGSEVYVCQTSRDEEWLGVVYEAGGELSSRCGVTAGVATPRRYVGPCQSGWVYSKYVDIYAG